jgi:hypothetical protein
MTDLLHLVEYEGPFMREDGWQHLRGGVKVREATPAELVAAVRNLAVEPDYGAAYKAYRYQTGDSTPQALHPSTVKSIVDAALAGRVVVPTEGNE